MSLGGALMGGLVGAIAGAVIEQIGERGGRHTYYKRVKGAARRLRRPFYGPTLQWAAIGAVVGAVVE